MAVSRSEPLLMDLEMTRLHLRQAERHVEQGERIVNRQFEILHMLQSGGHDTRAADTRLKLLQDSQALHIADRDRLRAMLARANSSRDTPGASLPAPELRTSETRFDLAAAAAGLALWSWDAKTNLISISGDTRSLFGLAADEALDIARVLSMIDAEDSERVVRVWRDAIASGEQAETQCRVRVAGGRIKWMLARGRSLVDATGRLASVQGVLRDVTEEQFQREEVEELRRELAHAGRVAVLGSLSSSLAHELGQPLGAILANAETAELLLRSSNPDFEALREIVADIVRDDRRAADVIAGVRKFLARRDFDFTPVPVEMLVEDVTRLLRPDAVARNVILECESEPALPPVRGDRVHLSQVLINILMNGMDSVADQPQPRRQVHLHAGAADNGHIDLTVRDFGPGIDPDLIKRIFEPFFTTKSWAMGLGLSVSRAIVLAHGGKLGVENSPGGGAVFRVRLPAYA